MLDGISPSIQVALTRDVLSAWQTIATGTVDNTAKRRQKYWKDWCNYTKLWGYSPFLTHNNSLECSIVITAFAARVRTGYFGNGKAIKVGSVTEAIGAISTSCQLAGQPSPVHKTHETYVLPVARLVEGMRRADPPAVPQLAIPVAVPKHMLATGQTLNNPLDLAIGDLAIIAFFFLLRIGEYTRPTVDIRTNKPKINAKRTVQFRISDIGFFKNSKILPRRSPLKLLLTADEVTLKITNQKNGAMGQVIHHKATNDPTDCPVQAVARRVHHILENNGNSHSCICDYFTPTVGWRHVRPTELQIALQRAVLALDLKSNGIDVSLISLHSFRAGGAMALKLAGYSDTTIMKFGRWKSLTFLQYIHNQIAHISTGVSKSMSTKLDYTNIAAIEAW